MSFRTTGVTTLVLTEVSNYAIRHDCIIWLQKFRADPSYFQRQSCTVLLGFFVFFFFNLQDTVLCIGDVSGFLKVVQCLWYCSLPLLTLCKTHITRRQQGNCLTKCSFALNAFFNGSWKTPHTVQDDNLKKKPNS